MGQVFVDDRRALLGRPNLLDPRFDSDACGTGFIAQISGEASHRVLTLGLTALARLAHRGAVAADGRSSDGVGIMTAIPRELLLAETSLQLDRETTLGVGAFFFPPAADEGAEQSLLAREFAAQGLRIAHWREVPTQPRVLGEIARATLPRIRQALIVCDSQPHVTAAHLETRLYLARQAYLRAKGTAYCCSLSATKLVYKALCAGSWLAEFYPDLARPEFRTPFLLFHQRYATNVLPSWERAQPLRMLAHNGEINTIGSNRARMAARDHSLPDVAKPVITEGGSDSTSLDEVAELLTRNGRSIAESLRMLIPPGPGSNSTFVRYHSDCAEPWDGPAALAFADGNLVGAALDRNGLRPCRYTVTTDGLVIAGSETGLIDTDPALVTEHGRLGPGEMFAVDLAAHRLLRNRELHHIFDQGGDYGLLLADQPFAPDSNESGCPMPDPNSVRRGLAAEELTKLQAGYGFTREDITLILTPMASEAREAVWSMGDDTSIAPLANTPRAVYSYFRQRFAQVTNPAIDPLRESCVFSMHTRLGPWPHLLYKSLPLPGITLASPFLSLAQVAALRAGDFPHAADLPFLVLPCVMCGDEAMPDAIRRLQQAARDAVDAGAKILILTDRVAEADDTPLPMALITAAVDDALTIAGLRTHAGLAVEAADAWDTHHAAVLIGLGAGAVCPWLALLTAAQLAPESGEANYLAALTGGLAKVMSKAGISAVDSYRSAQLFDVLGLAEEVFALCLPRSAGLRSGTGWQQLETQSRRRWSARHNAAVLRDAGSVRFRKNEDAERHLWQPVTVRALQQVSGAAKSSRESSADPANGINGTVTSSAITNSPTRQPHDTSSLSFRSEAEESALASPQWRTYTQTLTSNKPEFLRDLLDYATAPIPIEHVEAAQTIVHRFVASAMSLGSLSPEAHQAITDGMNLIGARSNTGEGGEDPELYREETLSSRPELATAIGAEGASFGSPDTRRDSRIKQIASGRFGVTAEYLARAEEIEIKISQGSKPGEGGQLPGHKVTALIARLRHAQPGSTLISPPPHHDIYSIEDLAQLIFDLKRVNPRARVGVKLVSSLGVGTVAAGVAKAYADFVVIAGHSGGTGASPLTSIKHAGNPWELGLAETQQVLIANGLRHRVRIRVDGGLRHGRDVVMAAMLGAEEFAFGTAVLVALGCDMARQCHLNTCPTGIATQREDLRAKFRGRPEHVAAWFLALADDVRAELARCGLQSLEDAVGRTDLIHQARHDAALDLSQLLASAATPGRRNTQPRNDRPQEPAADHAPPDDAWLGPALAAARESRSFAASARLRNSDRAIGTRLAGQLSLMQRQSGRGEGPAFASRSAPQFHFTCTGTAGQSFGAFTTRGMQLELTGAANDYVGKGLSGATLILRHAGPIAGESHRHVILGNVALYGATSGELFAAGRAGERFAVRNSGAIAVVEGLGDHGCEYMTGGTVLVLGATGINFGAGMTGGRAWVFDEDGSFRHGGSHARESVSTSSLPDQPEAEQHQVLALLQRHAQLTGSRRAQLLADNWHSSREQFVAIAPVTPHTAAQPDPAARAVAPSAERIERAFA